MDHLTLSIGPCEENSSFGGVDFLVTVSVNGHELADYLDVDEFFQALRLLDIPFPRTTKTRKVLDITPTRLPIFNCSCGCFGCGGYYVDVSVAPEALVWENRDNTASLRHRPWPNQRFSFRLNNVREITGELLAAIYNAIPQSSSGEVRCSATGDNVAARLPFYRDRHEALTAVAEAAEKLYETHR